MAFSEQWLRSVMVTITGGTRSVNVSDLSKIKSLLQAAQAAADQKAAEAPLQAAQELLDRLLLPPADNP